MNRQEIAPGIEVTAQLALADVQAAALQGFRAILCIRPDGEEPDQPPAAAIAEAAQTHGMAFEHIPVVSQAIDAATIEHMRSALDCLPRPILAYCRSGGRAARLYDLATAAPTSHAKVYDVVIVGGGSAGIATAASLLKRRHGLSIAIIDPAEEHYYQPGWTLVGAGVFRPEATRRRMAALIPHGVAWIKATASGFAPDERRVILSDGESIAYRTLVVAPGLSLDWGAIPGLEQALGHNGVTSNYRFDLAPYTHRLVADLGRGRALFTQPSMPIKCAGAPQKALYLSCDRWRGSGRLEAINVQFHTAAPVLFGVAAYVPALMAYIERYGIDLRLESRLIAVDGTAKVATFESKTVAGAVERTEIGFDLLHAVPPQVAPEFVRSSPLAAASGFVEVDEATLRHPRYDDIFALGDVCSASNAKTAAAARKQAPVVAENVLAVLDGARPAASYDGYGSCPLTVEQGCIVLAEFGYGGKLLPSFPDWLLNGRKPTRRAWFLKKHLLPQIYWHGMLKGREWLAKPHHLGNSVP
ncbi:MAG: hypothetical protein JWR80_4873 [Bradyrhizobium sp.]|nr:hypothetical protein [Bradyrhizobium sp.]